MRKCTRCNIELAKVGTVHLMTTNTGTTSIKAHMNTCPNCGKIELVKVEQ